MSDNRKYYYLKLKENYFDEDAMRRFQSCLIKSALLEWVGSARMTIWPWKS